MSQESNPPPRPGFQRGCLVAMLMILWPASDVLLGGLVVALPFRHPLSFLSLMVYRGGFHFGILVLIAALLIHYVIGPLGLGVGLPLSVPSRRPTIQEAESHGAKG
jgi:hypothetical protein